MTHAGTGGHSAGLIGTSPTAPVSSSKKTPTTQPTASLSSSSQSQEAEAHPRRNKRTQPDADDQDEDDSDSEEAEEEEEEEDDEQGIPQAPPSAPPPARKKKNKIVKHSPQSKPSPSPRGKKARGGPGRPRTSDRDFWTGSSANLKKQLLLEIILKHQGDKLEGKTKGSKQCWHHTGNVRNEFNAEAQKRGWTGLNDDQLRSRRRSLKMEAKTMKQKYPDDFEAGTIPPSVCPYGNLLQFVFGRDPTILLSPEEVGTSPRHVLSSGESEEESKPSDHAPPQAEEEKETLPTTPRRAHRPKTLRSNPVSFASGKRTSPSPSSKSYISVGDQLGKLAEVATSLFQTAIAPSTPGELTKKAAVAPHPAGSVSVVSSPSARDSPRPVWVGTISQASWNVLQDNGIDEEAFQLLEPADIEMLPILMGDQKKLIHRLLGASHNVGNALPLPRPRNPFSSSLSMSGSNTIPPSASPSSFPSFSPSSPPPPPPPMMSTMSFGGSPSDWYPPNHTPPDADSSSAFYGDQDNFGDQ